MLDVRLTLPPSNIFRHLAPEPVQLATQANSTLPLRTAREIEHHRLATKLGQ